MPELPEVETVVRTLRPTLLNRRIAAIVHLRRDIVTPIAENLAARLTGRRIGEIRRRGKRIIIQLDDGNCWYVHLGMTGRLTIEPRDAPRRPHTHLILDLGESQQLRFADPRRFGGVFWCGASPADESMGPEPLALSPRDLLQRLSRTKRAIKSALLDQKMIAGIGNIYADEALFDAQIHPLTIATKINAEQARRLNTAIKRVLKRAIEHRGSTLRDYVDANGEPGDFQKVHRVYDREGEPCLRCGRAIVRIIVAQRSTCFCPACQPKKRNNHR
jgi:formamidopyrimidine-DNA glycosylase